jgi:phosphatidylserine decarboxylase
MKQVWNRTMLRLLPKRTLTTWVGRFAHHRVSRYAIPWYVRHYHIDTHEAQLPLEAYGSLVDFFSRKLHPNARTVTSKGISSPVDGTVSEFGTIENGKLLQAKGSAYTLSALLGDADLARTYEGGDYITLYLSPRDYHRIHMPSDGTLIRWTYIPGTLYPVNPIGVKSVAGLFTKNERVVTHVASDIGRYAVIKVGATIVGSIRTEYGPSYQSPHKRANAALQHGTMSIAKRRGEELGWFEFGSTVILVFEKGVIQSFQVTMGQWVTMGTQLALFHAPPGKL